MILLFEVVFTTIVLAVLFALSCTWSPVRGRGRRR